MKNQFLECHQLYFDKYNIITGTNKNQFTNISIKMPKAI